MGEKYEGLVKFVKLTVLQHLCSPKETAPRNFVLSKSFDKIASKINMQEICIDILLILCILYVLWMDKTFDSFDEPKSMKNISRAIPLKNAIIK